MTIEQGDGREHGGAWVRIGLVLAGLFLVGVGAWLAWTGSEPPQADPLAESYLVVSAPGSGLGGAGGDEPVQGFVSFATGPALTPDVVLGSAVAAVGAALIGGVASWTVARRRRTPRGAAATLIVAGVLLATGGAALAWADVRDHPRVTTGVAGDTSTADVVLMQPQLTTAVALGLALVALGAALVGAGVGAALAAPREASRSPLPAAHADGTSTRRPGVVARVAVAAVVLVVAGAVLVWTSRPTTVGWFAYAPLSGTVGRPGSVSGEAAFGLVALTCGLLLLGGAAGWTLARRHPGEPPTEP